jgi:predicted alpha/beta-fold hydrolase
VISGNYPRHQVDAARAGHPSAANPISAFQPIRYRPRRWLSNGHLQTIVGNFLPRHDRLPTAVAELVEVSPAQGSRISSQVLCHCHWQPEPVRAQRLTVILVHGLEGSSKSQYIVGNANKLWRAGANVIRMNMRNCGGTEQLSPTLYHSGLSADVHAVLRAFTDRYNLQNVALAGYSMGGNLVLKLAGELGANPPPQLCAVVGVSPAMDLAVSADALHEPLNRLYERRFLKALLQRFRRKAMLFPRVYDPNRAVGITSIRDFDQRITALYSGFTGAGDYYFRAASARVLDRIAVPTLILHALDDPFIRITPETRNKIAANPCITFLETAHGGHCAFLSSPNAAQNDDGYWAESTLLQFLLARCDSLTGNRSSTH